MTDIEDTSSPSTKTSSDDFLEETKNNDENTLESSPEDITKLDFIEVDAPKYHPFKPFSNYPVDKATIHSHLPGMILWVFLWYSLGFGKTGCKIMDYFFVFGTLFWLRQIHYRRNEMMGHVDDEWDTLMQMREMVLIFFSIITVFTVFFKNIKSDAGGYDYLVLSIIIIILCVGILWYTIEDTSVMTREIRSIHNTSYTLSILLFMAYMIRTFICPYYN